MTNRPWERKWLRIAATLDYPQNRLALGYTVLQVNPPKPFAAGEEDLKGRDPVDVLIETYRKQSAENPGGQGITLYRYATRRAWNTSRQKSEGMTWAEHNALIDRAAERIKAEGINVIIEDVTEP